MPIGPHSGFENTDVDTKGARITKGIDQELQSLSGEVLGCCAISRWWGCGILGNPPSPHKPTKYPAARPTTHVSK